MKKTPLKKKTPLPRKGIKTKSGITKTGLKKAGFKKKFKHKPRNKIKTKSSQSVLWKLIRETDRTCSLLVRALAANKQGYVKCYTCDYVGKWKHGGIQCGHFKSRSNLGTRWLLDNLRPQDHKCNTTLNGNLEVFEKRLIAEIGRKRFKKLEDLSNSIVRMKVDEVRAIKQELNRLLKEVVNKKGL